MNDNVDLMVEGVRNKLLEVIQNSGLTASVTFYLLKDVYNTIEKDYNNYINILNQQKEKEEIKEMAEDLKNLVDQVKDDQEEN